MLKCCQGFKTENITNTYTTQNILQHSHFHVSLRVLKDKDRHSKWRRLRIIIQISTHWKTMGDCKHYLHHTPTLTEPTIILTCALIRLNAGFWESGTYVCVCVPSALTKQRTGAWKHWAWEIRSNTRKHLKKQEAPVSPRVNIHRGYTGHIQAPTV